MKDLFGVLFVLFLLLRIKMKLVLAARASVMPRGTIADVDYPLENMFRFAGIKRIPANH
jgi:hypothetical protein